jgi:hypothetical protein
LGIDAGDLVAGIEERVERRQRERRRAQEGELEAPHP